MKGESVPPYDYCVIGGGIVGLATALELLRRAPVARLLLIEKESALGLHQTGHNSGVIHAGVYYKPGSLKARLCAAGSRATKTFCDTHGIRYNTPGKLIVATSEPELDRMKALKANALGNGIEIHDLDRAGLRDCEPGVEGLGALRVPASGIVDYRAICVTLEKLILDKGGVIVTGRTVTGLDERTGDVRVSAGEESWQARIVVACAGLQADRVARMSGLGDGFRIVPFRGEYYKLRDDKEIGLRHMIYPVPDPALPFLGIHLTPTLHGEITLGPNAVLGFAREGYPRFCFDLRDSLSTFTHRGFWRVAAANWRSGIDEFGNSLSRRRYLEKCRKYYPDLDLEDLEPYRAGIRAQAVMPTGEMVHDFLFFQSKRTLHVANAPSPAATSAMPIAAMIADRLDH